MKANAAHTVESGPFEGSIGAFSSTLPKISLSSASARFLDPPAGTMRAYGHEDRCDLLHCRPAHPFRPRRFRDLRDARGPRDRFGDADPRAFLVGKKS